MARLTFADALDLAVHTGLRAAPTDVVSAFGAWAVSVRGAKAYPVADKRAAENMRRLRPDWDEARIAEACRLRWDNIGRLMAEYAVVDRLVREGRIEIRGAEHLAAAKAHGKGIVLLGLHLGTWEVYAPALASIGIDPAGFHEPRPTLGRRIITERVRRSLGATVFEPDLSGARLAIQRLRAGGAVALFADESVGGLVRGPFLGRRPHAEGNLRYAVQFARTAGCPIVPGYIRRTGGCRFVLNVLEPIHLPPEDAPGTARMRDIDALNAVMEPLVLANLDQWYFLHDRIE
jgi:KDO2-lipid IV(A) lauroyltransferase